MPGFIGLPEIILFGVVALLVFGPKRLPEMGRSLGHGLREFKDSVSGDGKAPVEVAAFEVTDTTTEQINPITGERVARTTTTSTPVDADLEAAR